MGVMSTPPRRHLASSPFRQEPEPTIEQYEVGELVSHDSYGMGRVTHVDGAAVTVNFGAQTVRIKSPFAKMSKL
jgi:predicted 2-oxoglutarate/Fe(II)-dependent dioxygenase YbiX